MGSVVCSPTDHSRTTLFHTCPSLNSLRIPPVTSSNHWMRNWVPVSLPLLATSGSALATTPTPSWRRSSNKFNLFSGLGEGWNFLATILNLLVTNISYSCFEFNLLKYNFG